MIRNHKPCSLMGEAIIDSKARGVFKMGQPNFAKNLRLNMTDAEHRLWYQLRLRQLNGYLFRRQAPMQNYVVDFVCYKVKLIIEIDGGQHEAQKAHDDERTAWLNSQGYRVIRFWNNEVMKNIAGVIEIIQKNLSELSGAPPP